jgi:hypothetical protein
VSTSDAFLLALLALSPLVLYRNALSYKWCMRRADDIHAVAMGLIHAQRFEDANRVQDLYGTSPQVALIFDLRVWSYGQAFPLSVCEQAGIAGKPEQVTA